MIVNNISNVVVYLTDKYLCKIGANVGSINVHLSEFAKRIDSRVWPKFAINIPSITFWSNPVNLQISSIGNQNVMFKNSVNESSNKRWMSGSGLTYSWWIQSFKGFAIVAAFLRQYFFPHTSSQYLLPTQGFWHSQHGIILDF